MGGRGGLLFYERLEVGLYYNHYQSQEASKAVEIRSLLGELSFCPFRGPSEGSALFVGALAGTSDSTNIGSLSKETTLGTRLGYDVRLGPKVSVSPEFYWLYILGSESFSLWGAHLVGTIRF